MGLKRFILSLVILGFVHHTSAQCEASLEITLENVEGGFFSGYLLTLIENSSGIIYKAKSNSEGKAEFSLPCNSSFTLSVQGYSLTHQIVTHPKGGIMTKSIGFKANDMEMAEKFGMTEQDKKDMDIWAKSLKDSNYIQQKYSNTWKKENYQSVTLKLSDVEGKALSNERTVLCGRDRNKSFIATTNHQGICHFYLPKGDDYIVNFTLTSAFYTVSVPYSNGISTSELTLSYLGTREILRRKKEEEERIKAEE